MAKAQSFAPEFSISMLNEIMALVWSYIHETRKSKTGWKVYVNLKWQVESNIFTSTWFFKVVFTTFLLVCIVCLKESTCKLRKLFFISLWKLFSFFRLSNFKFSDIQMSWRHQMPKHETRNTFYWITWEVNSLVMKFGQFM